MVFVRIEWLVLAVVSAVIATLTAVEPMSWISECQLGLIPTSRITSWEECRESTWAHYGFSLLAVLGVPVVLCLVPAVVPRRAIGWATAMTLTGVWLAGILATLGMIPGHGTMLMVVGYCLPTAFVAILLASFHNHFASLSERDSEAHPVAKSTGSSPTRGWVLDS